MVGIFAAKVREMKWQEEKKKHSMGNIFSLLSMKINWFSPDSI